MRHLIVVLVLLIASPSLARDDGRYANSPLKPWFDSLTGPKGPCCADADGHPLADEDWDTKGGHYRFRWDGAWYTVPDETVLKESNRAERTMIWLRFNDGIPEVRCFLPGTLT